MYLKNSLRTITINLTIQFQVPWNTNSWKFQLHILIWKHSFLPLQNLWWYTLPYITPVMWQNVADGTRIASFTCFNYVVSYSKKNELINKSLSVDSLVTGSQFLKPSACTQKGFVPYRALRSPTMGQTERNPAFKFIAFPLD
jgi:hypothetical protein